MTPAEAPAPVERFAPWFVPVYVGSLVFVFLGERIFSGYDWARYAFSGVGTLGVVVSTVLRLAGAMRKQGERRRIERALGLISTGGVVALALYFATTDAGKKLLGIATASPEVRARFEGGVTVAWVIILVIAVLPLLLGEAALAPMRYAERIESRRVRMAIRSGTILSCALVYCGLFTYAAGELDIKADFSYFRTARPSDSTKNVAASLNDTVKVMAFFPPLNEIGTEVDGYLRDLAHAAPGLQIETYDRLMVPAIAKEAKVTQDGVLVLTRGPAHESVVIGADKKSALMKLKTLDGDFQKALLKLLREQRIAYLTVGHGELNEAAGDAAAEGRTGKGVRKLLESQNYTVKDLGLTQGLGTDVPNDAYLVLLLGPTKALLPEEVASLKRYADRGGKLFLALDPDAKIDLGPVAAIVDLTWQPTVLANDKVFLRHRYQPSDRTILITNKFSSHASVTTLSRNSQRAMVVFPGASALDKAGGTDAKIDFAIKTMPDTFDDRDGNFEFDSATEKRSSYNVAAAVTRPAAHPQEGKGKDAAEMRAFVLGDADAVSDAALGNEPNILMVVDVLRWLGGEESFSGSIATTEDVRIDFTKQKDVLWFYGTILGIPLLVLGLGLTLTRKRVRRRRPAAPDARKPAPLEPRASARGPEPRASARGPKSQPEEEEEQ
jgi:ABC-type uncharacterized transport system